MGSNVMALWSPFTREHLSSTEHHTSEPQPHRLPLCWVWVHPNFFLSSEFLLGIVDVLSHKQFLIRVIQVYTHLREPKLNLIHKPRITQGVLTLANHKKVPHALASGQREAAVTFWMLMLGGCWSLQVVGNRRLLTFSFTKYRVVLGDLQPPELWENKYLLFKLPSLWYSTVIALVNWCPKEKNGWRYHQQMAFSSDG